LPDWMIEAGGGDTMIEDGLHERRSCSCWIILVTG